MAASVSPPGKYPGVYVQTLVQAQPPTGGASTSIAAFIGRTSQGPVNVPVTCLNLAEYQQQFGGLTADSSVSYQASGFFNNGGSQAEVVRLYRMSQIPVTALNTGATVIGTYTITLEPLVSGPTVQLTTGAQFSTTAPTTADDVYGALAFQLNTNPALAGLVTVTSQTAAGGGLMFDIAYPCNLSSGGPSAWTITPLTTGSGTATIPFVQTIALTMATVAKSTQAVTLSFSPPGATPFSISVAAPSGGWAAADPTAATMLYMAILRSSRAHALVSLTAPTTATLTLTYKNPVNLVLSGGGGGSSTGTPSTPVLFELMAANPGTWGNSIVASVDITGITPAVATKYGLKNISSLFNLTVIYPPSGAVERFTAVSLSISAGTNRLDRVLAAGSALVQLMPGLLDAANPPTNTPPLGVWGAGGGGVPSDYLLDTDYIGDPSLKTGLYAFNQNPYGFNILSIPPDNTLDANGGDVDLDVYQAAAQICVDNNAMLIIDPPMKWTTEVAAGNITSISINDLGSYSDAQARACAVYFPRLIIADPLRNGLPKVVVPSGYLAAVWGSVDAAVGVWKAPAGLDAPIGGILKLQLNLNNDQNGVLNPQGINALRFFAGGGSVVWGARTLRGADQLADPYKYIPVQRLLDFIETSLLENTRWAVFQPNGPSLWSMLQTQISVFMNGLFSQGAFSGTSASQAFFVKCDATTTPPSAAAAGIVNVQVGFAPINPAEFVVITISQLTASSG